METVGIPEQYDVFERQITLVNRDFVYDMKLLYVILANIGMLILKKTKFFHY